MKKYDACGRLAEMEIFSHGESEARSEVGVWQDLRASVAPYLRVRKYDDRQVA